MQKYLTRVTIFAKAPSWMYDWVLNMSLEGFVQDASRQELAIVPVVESLKTILDKSITNKLTVNSTTGTLLKNQIFVDVFLVEDYEYNALRKESQLLWESFTDRLYQYLIQFAEALLFC